MPLVKVQIDRDGNVKLDGEGFVGKQCDAVMDKLTRALGQNPDALVKHYKPEAMITESVTTEEHLGLG